MKVARQTLEKAIVAFSQAALVNDAWDEPLSLVEQAFGAHGACLVRLERRFDTLVTPIGCSQSLSRGAFESYAADFAAIAAHPRARTMIRPAPNPAFDQARANGEARRARVFADRFAPIEAGRFIAVSLGAAGAGDGDGGARASEHFLALIPESADGQITPEADANLAWLAHHVAHCLAVADALDASRRQAVALAQGLDHALFGCLLVSATGAVVWANAAARRALRAGDGLAVQGDLLVIADGEARQELDRMLERVGPGDAVAPVVVRAQRDRAALPYLLMIGPASGAVRMDSARMRRQPGGAPHLIVIVLDASDRAIAPEIFWRVLFKLSPGESAVAELLVKGLTPKAIAAARNVSRETIRAQLKRIFEKIDAANQSQAVSILMSASAVALHAFDAPTG